MEVWRLGDLQKDTEREEEGKRDKTARKNGQSHNPGEKKTNEEKKCFHWELKDRRGVWLSDFVRASRNIRWD